MPLVPAPILALLADDRFDRWSESFLDTLDAWYRRGVDTSMLAPFELGVVPGAIVALSLSLLAVRWLRARGRDGRPLRALSTILFVVTSALVLGHLLALGVPALAMTRPSQVGWLAATGGFLVVLAVALNLSLHLLSVLEDLAAYGGYSWRPGLLAWPIGLVLVLLTGWLLPWATILVVLALAMSQLVQVVLALRALVAAGAPGVALAAPGVYVLGTVTLAVFWLLFLQMLIPIAILIGLAALPSREGVTSSAARPRRRCTTCLANLSIHEGPSLCQTCSYKRTHGII